MSIDRQDGISFLTDFWKEKYLKEYVADGGSKMKFVTGRKGSGKTWLLQKMCQEAGEMGYQIVGFSAKEVWLHDFKEIYVEILKQCDIMACLEDCAVRVVKEMGYDPEEIPDGMNFMDYLAQSGSGDALTRREIRLQLKSMFLDNSYMDNNFAVVCSMLTGGILGHPMLEAQNRDILLAWLEGDRTVKLSLLRALGMSPSRITKFNARHMLRSLSEVVRLGGHQGLFVVVDDMEILLGRTYPDAVVRYTKVRREDTYESIRQLVDDIDTMHNLMFLFAFDRELMADERYGIKSYQALWMRIQNEVTGSRFNRFVDIVDMDRLAMQIYTPEELVRMSAEMIQRKEAKKEDSDTADMPVNAPCSVPISLKQAEELLSCASVGVQGLPGQVYFMTMGGDEYVR